MARVSRQLVLASAVSLLAAGGVLSTAVPPALGASKPATLKAVFSLTPSTATVGQRITLDQHKSTLKWDEAEEGRHHLGRRSEEHHHGT